MRRINRIITIGFLVTLTVTSSRTHSQQGPTTGSIEGVIVRTDTGEPIAGAQVTLNLALAATPTGGFVAEGTLTPLTPILVAPGQTAQAPQGTAAPRSGVIQPITTGADGKFSFKDLNAGSYRLAATANGFARQEYGQRTPTGQGRLLFVASGQTLKDANVRLLPSGVVSGRVFDENGQPATGAPVQLIRPVYAPAGRNLQTAGTGNVDDRGDYRIFGITPGRYYLVAGTAPGTPAGRGAAGARFNLVFFPNASDVEQASTIEVRSGTETSFDLRTRRQVQSFRVRGRILNPTGIALPKNVSIMLSYRTLNGGGSFLNGINFDYATGNFELQNVSPGEYVVTVQIPEQLPIVRGGPTDPAALFARQAAQASMPSGQAPVRVVDADVEGVVLTPSSGHTANGRIVVEGQAPGSVSNLERIRLNFVRPLTAPSNQTPPVASPPAADGTFQVAGLREGEFRVQAPSWALPGFYLKSIKFGGHDVLSEPLKFSGADAGEFEVVLRAGTAQVTGTVVDSRSQPVPGIPFVMLPNQHSRLDLYRPGTTDQNGRFSLPNVPPGSYKVFSWEAVDTSLIYDPEFLKQYEQQGKTVLVTESSNQNVEVKMIPAP